MGRRRRFDQHHGAAGMDARHVEGGRPDYARRPSDEGRLKGDLAILHDHARRKADVSRHRAPEGLRRTIGAADVLTTRVHENRALGRSLIAPAGPDSPRRSH